MKVIKNPEILRSTYIPEKLLHREDLVKDVRLKTKLGTGNIILYGPTGTGKTSVILNALKPLKNNNFIIIYINCVRENTSSSIAKRIIEDLKNTSYKEKGKSTSEVSNDLIKVLTTKRKKQVVFVFDEVDKLVNKERDHQQILGIIAENSLYNIILISNDVNALKNLDARIESRLSPEKKFVPPYFGNQILDILIERAKFGLRRGSYDIKILAKISQLIFNTSGDIREALNLLYELAVLSEKKKSKLSLDMIQEASDRVGEIDFDEVFEGLPPHIRLIVVSLVSGCLNSLEGYFSTKNLYNSYEIMAKSQGDFVVKVRQFERLLKQLEISKLIEIRTISPKNRRGREMVVFPKFDIKRFADKYMPRYSINDTALGEGERV